MSFTSATLAGRRAALRLMVDSCRIERRSSGAPVFDATSGTYTDPASTDLYVGPCRVRNYRQNNDRVVQFGAEPVSLWPFVVSVPIDVTGLQVDDLITITASVLDPGLNDLRLRVRDVTLGSQVTARRLGCEVNAG